MVRIALAALTASFAALTCAMAAPAPPVSASAEEGAETPEQQAEAPQSPAPLEGTAQTVAEQSEPPQTPPSAPSEQAARSVGNQAAPPRAEQPASAAVETVTQPRAHALQQAATTARFRVEAMGFRAVDESGSNHPDSDAVFAMFESQRRTMVTHVFDSVDTGDAKDFAADENCIFPVRDADEPRNGAWRCSPEGGSGPVRFAIAFYELDPDYVGSFTASFCTPEGAVDVEVRERNCDTEHADLLFRSELSYQVAEMLNRIDGACRCFSETVRYRESNAQGAVEYHVTFRITRTDEGAADAIPASADSTRAIFRHGARSAALGQGFELDGGVTAALGPDLAFSRAAPAELVLRPTGGAKIWPGDNTSRGHAACHAERRSANYVTTAVAAPGAGQYACYVTNSGRVGELRVDNLIASFSTAVLSVTFTTWQ